MSMNKDLDRLSGDALRWDQAMHLNILELVLDRQGDLSEGLAF